MRTIILDTETTGFGKDARVIELGAMALSPEGDVLGEYSSLVIPESYCPGFEKAQAVHGITPEVLNRAPAPQKVWGNFLSWMSLYAPITEVTAYNIEFDKRLMAQTFPDSIHLPWQNCVMKAAAKHIYGGKRIALAKAKDHFGLDMTENAHRALYDVRVTVGVWKALSIENSI